MEKIFLGKTGRKVVKKVLLDREMIEYSVGGETLMLIPFGACVDVSKVQDPDLSNDIRSARADMAIWVAGNQEAADTVIIVSDSESIAGKRAASEASEEPSYAEEERKWRALEKKQDPEEEKEPRYEPDFVPDLRSVDANHAANEIELCATAYRNDPSPLYTPYKGEAEFQTQNEAAEFWSAVWHETKEARIDNEKVYFRGKKIEALGVFSLARRFLEKGLRSFMFVNDS